MKVCDGKSTGVLLRDDQCRILMITRKLAPSGIAPIAGHVTDENPHLTHLGAAIVETQEEVGLTVWPEDLALVYAREVANRCRRIPAPSMGHEWMVFGATKWTGELTPSERETRGADWYELDEIQALAERTVAYAHGYVTEAEWQASPGLEPVWCDIFETIPKRASLWSDMTDTIVKLPYSDVAAVQKLYTVAPA
ncbi:NUDIX hydrolase [Nocardiopsis tropica]|uniref:NUDIX domain-containing protein n=1 Tax=Nocardiopsis tropica TaxID=109330 RepID=A0ABU7KRE4_9ACTN|nr:NUDIX domain-containing protein [Nocardiopsis umidischolae]MEE2051652.1 NUDIX domain-containing protein [Nocardiopsis umidischolae]